MPEEVNDVLQVTGLTPAPVEPESTPAAPTAPEPEARPVDEPAATEDTPQEATAHAPAAPAEDDDAPQAPKKPSRGVQKALDRLTERAVTAETQNGQLSSALAAVLAQFRQPNQPAAQAPQQQAVDGAPKREEFFDWEQYNRAVSEWTGRNTARQEVGNFIKALVGAHVQTTAQAETAARLDRLEKAKAKAPERFADWDDIVASDALMTPSLFNAITLSDDPVLVMHHLGIHPEEHAKLIQMSPEQQAYNVGRIVSSVQTPSVVSKAPAPAKPIGSSKASHSQSQYRDDMNAEQHKAFMQRQGVARGLR